MRTTLLCTLAGTIVASLACGFSTEASDEYGDLGEDPTDPVRKMCQRAFDCGCPGEMSSVEACMDTWSQLLGFGFRVATVQCYGALDCQGTCNPSANAAGARCAQMAEQDNLNAQSAMQQRSHETTMGVIHNMEPSGDHHYDQEGNYLGQW